MTTLKLFVFGCCALLTVVVFFLFGFLQFGSDQDAAQNGLVFGVASAGAWAVGSIGGPARWNNTSNVLAAFFAATSLGLLAPSEQICNKGTGYVQAVCAIRAEYGHHPAS